MSCCGSSGCGSKWPLFGFLAAAGLAAGGVYYAYNAQDPAPVETGIKLTSATQPEQPDAETQMMMDLATPGEHHKWLEEVFVGTWNAEMSFSMGPDVPAMTSKGTSVTKGMLEGRFFHTEYKVPDFMGMPFEGHGLMGYDNHKKEFVSTWVDNMTTSITMMTGQKSADGKSITVEGDTIGMDGQPTRMKMVYKLESKDKFVEEFYMGFGPDKVMEKIGHITHTRAK